MNRLNRSADRNSTWARLRKWLRVVPRRRYRVLRSSARRWNRTRGEKWRQKAQQTSHEVAERTKLEVDELKTDTRERYEKTRPRLVTAVRNAKDRAANILRTIRRWMRIAASIVATTLLLAAIAVIIFFIVRDTDSPGADIPATVSPDTAPASTDLICQDCPAFEVTRIIDGDTFDSSVGRIRIYGADTPERGEACYYEATEEMRRLAGDIVRGERGPRTVDQFGRNLYYIYTLSGASIDELLIRNGFAVAWTQDGQHRSLLIGAEVTARRDGVGCLWN